MPVLTRLVSKPLQTERESDGKRRLLRDLVVDVEGNRITVPSGFLTDFSSRSDDIVINLVFIPAWA